MCEDYFQETCGSDPQATHKRPTSNSKEWIILERVKQGPCRIAELMDICGYKDRTSFRKSILNPMIENGYVAMSHPERPTHSDQQYQITELGKETLGE